MDLPDALLVFRKWRDGVSASDDFEIVLKSPESGTGLRLDLTRTNGIDFGESKDAGVLRFERPILAALAVGVGRSEAGSLVLFFVEVL
jgi:hypothetical protein